MLSSLEEGKKNVFGWDRKPSLKEAATGREERRVLSFLEPAWMGGKLLRPGKKAGRSSLPEKKRGREVISSFNQGKNQKKKRSNVLESRFLSTIVEKEEGNLFF